MPSHPIDPVFSQALLSSWLVTAPEPSNTAGPKRDAEFPENTFSFNVLVASEPVYMAPPPPSVASLSKNSDPLM
jgi:hypothetical protein